MQISENWLREWVQPTLSSAELAHQITMAGLEVDAIELAAPVFSGVVVAEVLSTATHPNADSLAVCQVSDGVETFQVVCGAPNVRAGLRVPFARVGAKLPGDFKIKKAKLRGEASLGMLCGASEIGLEDKIDGLLELPANAPIGMDIREFLGLDDNVIEVDLTPNRADCLSVRGIAREVAALNKLAFDEPAPTPADVSHDAALNVKLSAPMACPRYLGRVIKGVDVSRPSPLWLVEKLRRAGVRSVDVVVDVTNFVLLELGQPLHAFDVDKLSGDIDVRFATKGESLTLLNDQEVTLADDTLVIADASGAVALAGVMGGAATAVGADSTNIFLESAFFAPLALAGQARRYGLHTDASHRYERGVDWQLQTAAIERASQLIIELAGGACGPLTHACDADHLPELASVDFDAGHANQLLALDIDASEMAAMLERLGFNLKETTVGCWRVMAPSWRFDIEREEDLVEEVARLYGYDRLPSRLPSLDSQPTRQSEARLSERRQADLLVDRGYREVITYSFVEPTLQAQVTGEAGLSLLNPISSDLSVMRTSLWPGLLSTAVYNLNRQVEGLRLFETGLRFVPRDGELVQEKVVAGLCCGPVDTQAWEGKPRPIDFYDLKGDVEALLALTGKACDYHFAQEAVGALHPGQTAVLYRGAERVGELGRIHPALAAKLGVGDDVFLFEFKLEALTDARLPSFSVLSAQPTVRRDLAFILDETVAASKVIDAIRENSPESLVSLRVFDVYQGDKLDPGLKSIALALGFQHPERTLKEVEISGWIDTIVVVLKQQFNAQLRD